ncbi:hypothetical protein D3C81_2095280 [compost metagenome]
MLSPSIGSSSPIRVFRLGTPARMRSACSAYWECSTSTESLVKLMNQIRLSIESRALSGTKVAPARNAPSMATKPNG